ncbi:RNase P modulator RnpM [Bacillus fonticola]|uniref:RNase P modulator RnpM n=1 Tax=Bacillus fonticola TaxID=2728853 RepID=UPI0014766F75|nr:YlxR family protein [Bacillus fonticola]
MAHQKKIPMRKCVATGEMRPKKEMVRIVRTKEGELLIDPTGKKSGRGAYVSKTEQAVKLAKQKNVLSHHLQTNVQPSLYDELLQFVEKENL